MPLIFSLQQAMEGGQWLALGGIHLPISTMLLANAYAILAFSIWPAYSSVAAMLIEPDRFRRLITAGLVAVGIFVAIYGAMHISAYPYTACIVGHTLSYSDGAPYSHLIFAAYLASACLPLLLSSYRFIRWFGVIVLSGLIVAWLFYFKTRFSVWCFFAALASATVYLHFAIERRPLAREAAMAALGRAAQ
jgi:hypothetical protein